MQRTADDCKEFRENFIRLEQLVQFSANSEYSGLLDGIAYSVLNNSRFMLRISKLESSIEEKYLARPELEKSFALKHDMEMFKRDMSGSMNSVKQRVQDVARESKDLEQQFSGMRSTMDQSASADTVNEIADKLKDYAPTYRVSKIETALENYLLVRDFQTYGRKTATELQNLKDEFRFYLKKDEFNEDKRELDFQLKKLEENSSKKADCQQDKHEMEYVTAKIRETLAEQKETNGKV